MIALIARRSRYIFFSFTGRLRRSSCNCKSLNPTGRYRFYRKLWFLRSSGAVFSLVSLGLLLMIVRFQYRQSDLQKVQNQATRHLMNVLDSSATTGDGVAMEQTKTILIYTNLSRYQHWPGYDEAPDHLKSLKCPIHTCQVTYNRSMLNMAAAVVFHARDMPSADHLWEVSRNIRPPWQRWAYYIAESPFNTPNPAPLDGLFNLTMTYRLDSDVFCPYRKFRKLEANEIRPDPNINYAQSKSKMVAWMASHCVGFRDRAVEMLGKYGVQVNTGGRCSHKFANKLQCDNRACRDELRRHKFYLSFENSFCQDYITEKFWTNAFEHDLVPIVLGGADYSNPSVAIPNSFIDVQDFSSYKELAEYIQLVASNDTLYNSYFAWKQNYVLENLNRHNQWPHARPVLCGLCSIVRDKNYPQKVYDKLSEFWGAKATCNKRGSDKEFFEML